MEPKLNKFLGNFNDLMTLSEHEKIVASWIYCS